MTPAARPLAKGALAAAIAIVGPGSALLFSSPAWASGPSVLPTPSAQSITTIAGDGVPGYSGDGGVAVNAELNTPGGVSEDLTGSLYIGDTLNNRIRKVVNPTSINKDIVSTYAGDGTGGFSGEGGKATLAELSRPTATVLDSSGDLFIADTGNNRVREVLASNGNIVTVAGDGACGRSAGLGDGGLATRASLCAPAGVALDSHGDLFVSDTGHSEVREVLASGTIEAYAGTGSCGYSGDGGPAIKAKVCGPTGLALDSGGDLFVADTLNTVIREVAAGGTIKTFAGTGKFGFSGDGGTATKARLSAPTGVAVDQTLDVFIADTLNQRIRKVDTSGTISTYAGNGKAGFSGDGGPATSAELKLPAGSMSVDGTALYFSDTGNERVRGVFSGPPPVLPETNWAVLLPLSAAALLGGGFLAMSLRRRRSNRVAALRG